MSEHARRLYLETLGQAWEKTDWQWGKLVACENGLG